jgi:hypothetical protein
LEKFTDNDFLYVHKKIYEPQRKDKTFILLNIPEDEQSKKKTKMSNKKIGVDVINQPTKAAITNSPVKAAVINRPVKVTEVNRLVKLAAIDPHVKAAAINQAMKVAVFNQPAKDEAELQKFLQNVEVISKFVEKI